MDDWSDILNIAGVSLVIGIAVALMVCLPVYAVLQLIHRHRKGGGRKAWIAPLKPLRWVGGIFFSLAFLPSVGIELFFSDMCGTSDVTEVRSPDGRHKVVVYAFDCGATTDFSLVVSVLRDGQRLPRHKTALPLYSRYHDCPVASGPGKNFEVKWIDASRVTVKIAGLEDQMAEKREDGVAVQFAPMKHR